MKRYLIGGLSLILSQPAQAVRPVLRTRTVPIRAPLRQGVAQRALPQLVRTALYQQPVTLIGQTSSTEVSIFLDPLTARQSPPQLHLFWDVSAIVNLGLSTITVELDDGPLLSTTLQRVAASRTIDLSLSGVSGGFHVLRIRTRLLTSADPCHSLYDRELWLRLSPDSTLSYLRTPAPQSKESHVGGILSAWEATHQAIALQPMLALDRGAAGAYLQAARWLGQQGLRTEGPQAAALQPSLLLRTSGTGPLPGLPWESALLGCLERQGSQLVATARSGDDLEALFVQLQHRDSLLHCTDRTCLLSRHHAAPPSPEPQVSADTLPSDAVATLAQQGHPRGFTARGGGWHQLRLNWEQPPSFALSGVPELRLDVQSAALTALDRNGSSITVKMGDRPLASFSPGMLSLEAMPLRIKIPPELRDQRVWSFEIEINLRTVQTGPCQASDDSTLWITLGASSGVYVQHRERLYPGTLTSVAELAQKHPLQIVFHRSLSWPAVAALSAVLAKLSYRPHWQVVHSQAECGPLCIVPQVGALPESSPLALLGVGSELHWVDRYDAFHMPLISASSSVFLDIPKVLSSSASLRTGEQLWVHFPIDYSHTQVPDSPDFSALPYGHLLWSKSRWIRLGDAVAGVLPVEPSAPAGQQPSQKRARYQVPVQVLDALWLLGSALLVYLAARIAKRRRKPSTVMNF